MQLEYSEKEESVVRSKQVAFALPAKIRALSHGDLRVRSTPDGTVLTVREDGVVNYWSPELKLKKTKSVFVRSVPPRTSLPTSPHCCVHSCY